MKEPAIGIVISRFNESITSRLLASCLETLKNNGIRSRSIRTVFVPGGYELPWAVQELALTRRYDVIIALGCILKGATPQNDHIARSTIQHLHDISLATRIPCVLGVMTPSTHAQAVARTKGNLDRGKEAAMATLELLKLKLELFSGS